jgi:hypothetical protein
VADRSEPSAEAPEFSETRPIAVGIAIWAALLVIGLARRHELAGDGRGWWIWTAAAGVALGGLGYLYMLRRQARLRARASRRDQRSSDDPGPTNA